MSGTIRRRLPQHRQRYAQHIVLLSYSNRINFNIMACYINRFIDTYNWVSSDGNMNEVSCLRLQNTDGPSCFHPKTNLSSTYCNKMLNGTTITTKSTSNPMYMINSALLRDLIVVDQYQLDYEWVRIEVWFWAEVLTGHYIASGTNETKQSPVNRLKNKSMTFMVLAMDDYGLCWVNRKAQYAFSFQSMVITNFTSQQVLGLRRVLLMFLTQGKYKSAISW